MIIKIDVEGSECVVISFLTLILFRLRDGVPGTPPLTFFGDNLKSITSKEINFFTFLTNYQMSLTLGLKRGFYTNYLSPLAYCLNVLFYFYPTKFIFRPTSGHWISTFDSSLESLEHKEADCTMIAKKFCIRCI